ncbi:hypothetical protein RclHR1_01410019 [Rhizophagus clarus]|nr:hypothetical protein RclHR1_01410019 [Rhizophagus clarus]
MESLKKKFTPRPDKNEIVENYLMLIYSKSYEENDDDEITDDNIPSASTRRQWQYAHCIEFTNKVEDLPSVNTSGLLEKVQAAIYLSLNKLWAVLTNTALIATFLDSNLNILSDDNVDRNSVKNDDGGLFNDLEGNYIQTNIEEEDKISHYIKSQDIRIKDDPLMWWSNHRDSFSTLVQLARKYLSIPVTSVLSERLFSDARNHVLAKRT